ncbi:PepSY domain-containing protein [Methyloceanibacter sp. wino2]|uniref:PepSY domain-containing protein n=1 Tax=Methyloceanibacter sp. wino2 TaxID=2170729 RepID=UPI000D3EE092|nr:PepSY domain-containing protein [Methyloceanibacter sp. wino2]
MKKYATNAVLGLSMLIAVPTLALADRDANRLNVPRDQWLAPSEIADRLSSKGYKVTEIEADDGAYEADVVKNGTRMEVHVHPATGEILVGYDRD